MSHHKYLESATVHLNNKTTIAELSGIYVNPALTSLHTHSKQRHANRLLQYMILKKQLPIDFLKFI